MNRRTLRPRLAGYPVRHGLALEPIRWAAVASLEAQRPLPDPRHTAHLFAATYTDPEPT